MESSQARYKSCSLFMFDSTVDRSRFWALTNFWYLGSTWWPIHMRNAHWHGTARGIMYMRGPSYLVIVTHFTQDSQSGYVNLTTCRVITLHRLIKSWGKVSPSFWSVVIVTPLKDILRVAGFQICPASFYALGASQFVCNRVTTCGYNYFCAAL